MAPSVGDTRTLNFTVTDGDTAIAMESGDVPVLGTPRLISWCEAATCEAIADGLEDGTTTVGYQIRMDHLSPTPIGAAVSVTATVTEVDGRRITFSVNATDTEGDAASGTITRVVVDRSRFIDKAND